MQKIKRALWEALEIACLAFLPLFICYQFLGRPFLVQGASMEPNFQNGNYLIVDVLSYKIGDPVRGDVIVFHYPGNRALYFIKRIIALPGDKITFDNGKMYINGKESDEKYIPSDSLSDTFTTKMEFTLTDNQYFVMGDNRAESFDSRSWGPLSKDDIVGIVRARLWPPLNIYTEKNEIQPLTQ
jgi:signal peptidase I